MPLAPEIPPEEFFSGHPFALTVHRRVLALLDDVGPHNVRITRSQVAYSRHRAFAWLWLPGTWLTTPDAEVVLSFSLGRHDPSPRFKEVVQPTRRHWMHHLEVRSPADLDDDVVAWLREAYERAG